MSDQPINLNGDVPETKAPSLEDASAAGIARIRDMIADADKPVADISRAIALQIADVMAQTQGMHPATRGLHSMTDMGHQVKSLRELQKTLTESEVLSKRDVLNIDGPKFKFVFQTMLEWFQRAMKDAEVSDELAKNVMRHFGDLVRSSDEQLRKDINKA